MLGGYIYPAHLDTRWALVAVELHDDFGLIEERALAVLDGSYYDTAFGTQYHALAVKVMIVAKRDPHSWR